MINCSSCNNSMLKANFVVIATREASYINVLFIKKNRKKKIKHGQIIAPPKKILHYQSSQEEIESLKLEGWSLVRTWTTKGKEIVEVKNICKECEKNDKT